MTSNATARNIPMLTILLQPEDTQIDWSFILDRLSKTYLAFFKANPFSCCL